MTLDQHGKDLLAVCEGIKLKPYLCSAGKPTIGIGSTFYENGSPVKLSDKPITIERAWELFEATKIHYDKAIKDVIKVPLKQQQYNALFCFAYNVGPTGFKTSELVRKVNAHTGDVAGITQAFHNWDGKNDILLSRRTKEVNEYFRNV